MNINLIYVAIFVTGLIAQAFFMLASQWKRGDLKAILISLGTGLIGMFPSEHEDGYNVSLHLLLFCCLAAFFFAGAFRKRLIRFIGARSLIVINIIMLFVVYHRFGPSIPLFAILLVPTLVVLANGFTDIDKNFKWQVFFYAWYVVMIAIIGLVFFAFGDFLQIFGWGGTQKTIPIFSLFFMGAAFLYIISNLWYIIELIPYRQEHQSYSARMAEIRQHMQLLAYGYMWKQKDFFGNMAILVALPILVFINYYFQIISENYFIAIVLSAMPLMNKEDNSPVVLNDGIGEA
jgi:hypothetical protein